MPTIRLDTAIYWVIIAVLGCVIAFEAIYMRNKVSELQMESQVLRESLKMVNGPLKTKTE